MVFHVMTDHVGINTALVYLRRLAERPEAAIEDFKARLVTYFRRVDTRLRDVPYLAEEVSIGRCRLFPIIIRWPYLVERDGLEALRS